jgi:putative glutamine amidotransferase
VVEAVENDDASIQAVQWHPENLWQNSKQQERIFTAFFDRVAKGED